ncbi:MAG: hypothetical protein KTR25_00435 [Myxococcales bacterium]|nr:hypothetical protein [Myxococcales bacterium]
MPCTARSTGCQGVSLSSGPASDLFPACMRGRWLRHPFQSLGPVHPVSSLRGLTITNAGYGVISTAGG